MYCTRSGVSNLLVHSSWQAPELAPPLMKRSAGMQGMLTSCCS